MKRLPAMLFAWGDWWARHIESMGHPHINWLHRVIYEGGARADVVYSTDDNGEVFQGRDRILCPSMPKSAQKVQRAVNKLSNREKKCVTMRYCAPLKDDSNRFTDRELAHVMKMSCETFKEVLRAARKKLAKDLDT